MVQKDDRRWLLRSALALAGAAWLPATRACEVQGEFLRVTHPWTRATAPDAEFGVLCMRIDEVTADDRLIDVHTPVADGVVLVGAARGAPLNLALPAGSDLEMHEHGLHLRLAPLRITLHAGRSYPLRLTFARSGVLDTILSVDFARFV